MSITGQYTYFIHKNYSIQMLLSWYNWLTPNQLYDSKDDYSTGATLVLLAETCRFFN
ncbi:MAG: hypothetical protein KME29_34340 [Calothrix sp. FI2-JRJ7]|nr:hypothetical protein [Calothrix sp. FI2-JRJ7]